jgi:O-antigen ligase
MTGNSFERADRWPRRPVSRFRPADPGAAGAEASVMKRPAGWGTDAVARIKDAAPGLTEMRWNFAFLSVLFYAFIEYSRLPEMYPIFQPLQLGKVTVILMAMAYAFSPRVRAIKRPREAQSIDVAMVIFIAGNFVGACFAEYHIVWDKLLDAVLWGAVYFLVTRMLSNAWQIRILLLMIFVLNLKLAQHTIRSYREEANSGMNGMQIIMSGGAGEGSASFFGNVADLGLAMCVVWGIVWAWLVGKAEKQKWVRWFLMLCFVTFFLAILLCGSRGAVVGAGAIVLVALLKSKRRVGAIFLTLFFVLAIWLVLPEASKLRFANAWAGTDANANSRIEFWHIGFDMWKHNPIFGIGPGIFAWANPLHFVSHSVFVQVLAESGLVGTISWAVMLFYFLRLNAKTRKRALASGPDGRRSFEYCLAFGLDLGMAGFLASGAFLAVLYYPHFWILLSLSVALNKCAALTYPEVQPVEAPRPGTFALAAR